jgi:hypothetical protein
MTITRDIYDSASIPNFSCLHEQIREEEVADMADTELTLKTVDRLRIWASHDSSIVNQDINVDIRPLFDLLNRPTD